MDANVRTLLAPQRKVAVEHEQTAGSAPGRYGKRQPCVAVLVYREPDADEAAHRTK